MLAPFPPRIPDGPSWSNSPISLQPHLGPLPSFPAWLFPSISIPSFTICWGSSGLLSSLSAGCHASASNSHLGRGFPHLRRPYQGVKPHIQQSTPNRWILAYPILYFIPLWSRPSKSTSRGIPLAPVCSAFWFSQLLGNIIIFLLDQIQSVCWNRTGSQERRWGRLRGALLRHRAGPPLPGEWPLPPGPRPGDLQRQHPQRRRSRCPRHMLTGHASIQGKALSSLIDLPWLRRSVSIRSSIYSLAMSVFPLQKIKAFSKRPPIQPLIAH